MKPHLILAFTFLSLRLVYSEPDSVHVKHKKAFFDISVEPAVFFTIGGKTHTIYNYNNTFIQAVTYKLHHQYYGGIDLGLGALIKNKFYTNFLTGVDCNNNSIWLPLGADFKVNITHKKIAPFIHVGGGYMAKFPYPNYNPQLPLYTYSNGVFAIAGFGIYAKVAKFMTLTFSPDYRFIYNIIPVPPTYSDDAIIASSKYQKIFYHQIALKVSLIFGKTL